MKREKLPMSLRLVQGAIGRRFVIKHYSYGVIKTKFPDMSKVTASKAQRTCRDLFKEAVAFAKTVLADEPLRLKWKTKMGKQKHFFNALIKHYLQSVKEIIIIKKANTSRLIRRCFATIHALLTDETGETSFWQISPWFENKDITYI